MSLTHLVAGLGEVGQALLEVLEAKNLATKEITNDVWGLDIGIKPDKSDIGTVDVLHIAFPWSEDFEEQVRGYIEEYSPTFTVVHSTVPVGTCSRLGVCHSPVRGRHPHLVDSLIRFDKFVAGPGAYFVAKTFEDCGMHTRVVENTETTEAGKLWELLMFGLAVAQQKEMYAWCEKVGADPEIAYAEFTDTYNYAYGRMGMRHVWRPIIEDQPGKIGGHCVIEHAPMIDHEFSELLLKLNETW